MFLVLRSCGNLHHLIAPQSEIKLYPIICVRDMTYYLHVCFAIPFKSYSEKGHSQNFLYENILYKKKCETHSHIDGFGSRALNYILLNIQQS